MDDLYIFRVHMELREKEEIWDPMVLQDQLDHLVHLDLMEHLVYLEQW